MKGRPCWLPTWLNHIGFIVIDNRANDKDAAEGATWLNRIGCIVINEKANNKDAAAGANWMNLYRLRHWRQREQQRRRFRRNNYWTILALLSSTMERTTKTPPRAKWRPPVVAAKMNDAANRMFHLPCIRGRRLMMRSRWPPGQRGRWTTRLNAPKSMKSMKGMKE